MNWNKVQLMFHGSNIGNYDRVSSNNQNIKIQKVHPVENKNYLFVDVVVAPTAKAGNYQIKCAGANGNREINF